MPVLHHPDGLDPHLHELELVGVEQQRPGEPLPEREPEAVGVVLVGISRCPLFRGPLIIGLYVLILPYLAKCLYK